MNEKIPENDKSLLKPHSLTLSKVDWIGLSGDRCTETKGARLSMDWKRGAGAD